MVDWNEYHVGRLGMYNVLQIANVKLFERQAFWANRPHQVHSSSLQFPSQRPTANNKQ